MDSNNNYIRFPNNLFAPEMITVDDKTYKIFLIRFDNLYDIYDYINENPTINIKVFDNLSSINGSKSFAGLPFDEALEDMINFDDPEYLDFVDLVKEIANVKQGDTHKYRLVRTLAGGYLNTPLYSIGSPLCYETQERIKKPKFINIYSTLSSISSLFFLKTVDDKKQ